MKTILTCFFFLMLSALQPQDTYNIAHGGPAGVYIYNPFEPCSPEIPNKDGALRVKVERRAGGNGTWQAIGYLQAPSGKTEFVNNYKRYMSYALAPDFTNPKN